MKRILQMLLGMLMTLPVFAQDFEYTYEGQTLKYTVTSEDKKTVNVSMTDNSLSGELKIPTSVTDSGGIIYSVTSIKNRAFFGCEGLTSVTVPASVTSIGEYAFARCSSLISVTVPASVTSIGENAFARCSSLTSMYIPAHVTKIEMGTFSYCSSLIEINVDSSNKHLSSMDGVLFNKDKTTLIAYPGGKYGSYIIPETVKYTNAEVFNGCIGLTSVTIPEFLTFIYGCAFDGCSSLIEISVNSANEGLSSIDGVLFNKDTTRLIAYPRGRSGSYTIPDSVNEIGSSAFSHCSGLISVTIPSSVTRIESRAFQACNGLTSMTIPSSVTSISSYAFCNCTCLTSVAIPSSVTSISSYTFCNCSALASVDIPESITDIPKYAFSGCNALTTLKIPSSVTEIDSFAFNECNSLTSVYYDTDNPISARDNIFANVTYNNATLFVPLVAIEKYRQISPWINFSRIEAYDFAGVVEIGNGEGETSVYSLAGHTVLNNLSASDITSLEPGVYIIRQGKTSKKIVVK